MSSGEPEGGVLFLLGTLEIGGSETKFVGIANRFRKRGLPVHIAYLRGPDSLLERIDNVPTVHLERRGKWSFRAYRNLARYTSDNNIRSIVTVNPYPLCYAIPLAMTRNATDLRVVSSINTSEFLSSREQFFMKLYAPLLRRAKHLVFGSERQQSQWLKKYNLPLSKACVIYNGVDADRFSSAQVTESRHEIRKRLGIPDTAIVIVCVSQLRPEKAHVNLLEAVAMVEERSGLMPYVLLVGDGAEKDRIEQRARTLGIASRLNLCGSVSDVRPYLKAANIFALTSVAVETFSNAALEAYAMGLSVVISDVGGANEMFPDDSSGIVYPRNDVEYLATVLTKLINQSTIEDGDLRRTRDGFLERFSLGRMDQAWKDLLFV